MAFSSHPRDNFTMSTHIDYSQRKAFELGQCLITAGADRVFSRTEFIKMIIRHAENDWGDLCEEDKEANKCALEDGSRIVSKYVWPDGREALVITEAEDDNGLRLCTTVLLPEEY